MSQQKHIRAIPTWGISFPDKGKQELGFHVAPIPSRVIIPLQQHIGVPADVLVKDGEHVLTGQPIGAMREHMLGAKIHASISGVVSVIGPADIPGRRNVNCIEIRSDGRDERWPGYEPNSQPLQLSTAALRQGVIEAGIVGLGGATFPTGVKLNRGGGVETLILNGAECEPCIRCDDAVMRHSADQILLGAQIMLRIIEANECIVAIKEGMDEATQNMSQAISNLGDDRFRIVHVPTIYPVGGEPQLIELLTGTEIPSGGLPWDSGAICQNVGTALAVARFLTNGEPLIRRMVTINGAGVAAPCNIDARLGTPVNDLIALAGGYSNDPARLIMGGPMMGVAFDNDTLPITKASNCIYVAAANELPEPQPELPCIRCGECSDACPVNLMPQLLHQSSRGNDFERLGELGVSDCIECGVCDYVCPSHIPLTRSFRSAKESLWNIAWDKRRAENAAARYAAREERLSNSAEQDDLIAAGPISGEALEELMRRAKKEL